MLLWLSFYTYLEIPHFFCDLHQMVKFACSDTFLNDIVLYFSTGLLAGGPLVSFTLTLRLFLSRISSAHGTYKAFPPVHLTSQLPPCLLFIPRSVPYLCCYPQLTLSSSSLSDVQCCHTHASSTVCGTKT